MADAAAAVILGALEAGSLADDERRFLAQEQPAGLTLFARNIPPESEGGLAPLTKELQALRRPGSLPMIIAIDQDGGRVARLKGDFPNAGPALELEEGRRDAKALAGLVAYGERVGSSLRELGVNVNFAPVVDVLTEASNHAIGDRCFGKEPESVRLRAGAFMTGLQRSGVFGCLKHFPGQGAATVDTHAGQAVIDKSLAELEACELYPFRALLAQTPMVMASHCVYPQLDPAHEASLSPRILKGLLRDRLGFRGLVVSDDMTMGAIVGKEAAFGESIVAAVAAGVDLLLVCRGLRVWQESLEALRHAASQSSEFRLRLAEAAERVQGLRAQLCV